MAEKKIIELEVKSNFTTAEKQLKDLSTAIKNTDKDATNLDATFEEIYGDLQPLTTRMGEAEDRLYELGLAGKQGTKEFKDLLTSVGNYRRVQIQTDMVVDAAATTLGQKLGGSLNAVAGGFALAQGTMSLFGTESESVEQAILKVQSAMAISQGVETIVQSGKSVKALGTALQATTVFQKTSTTAQYLFNAAMSANPIGALVVAISALLIGGYKLIKFFKDSSDANEKSASSTIRNTNALKEQSLNAAKSTNNLKTYNEQQYALAQAAGMSSEGLRKLALKHKEEEIALNKKNAVLAQSTFLRERDTLASLKNSSASDEVIANQEKLTQETYKSFQKQNELLSNSYKERAALRNANTVAEVSETKANNDKAIESQRTANDKKIEKAKEDAAALKAFQDDVKANQGQMNIDSINQKVQEDLDEKDRKQKSLEDISAMVDAIDAEDLKKAKATSDAKIQLAKKEKEQKIEALQATAQTLNGLAGLLGKQTTAGKIAAVASATIETFLSAQKAYSSTVGIPIVGPVLAPINAGIAIAAGIKNVKSILSVKTPGGGGGSAPSMSGSSASAVTTNAPNFNVVGASQTNQLAQTIGSQQNQPIKAYVVANDVTTQQALDRNIKNSATIS